MEKSIAQYQKAFNSAMDKLKANDSILAVMVFGSMVTGDLWEESDIDLFVIADTPNTEIKNVYAEEKGVPIHIKLMNKEKFLRLGEQDLKGGFLHRIFSSSRLVFSRDKEITERYDGGRYYPDLDRERWNMVYLGKVLKSLSVSKKYLCNEGIYTSYISAVKSLEEYAKLFINSSGYMINKDALAMAVNVSEDFKTCLQELFEVTSELPKKIEYTINYIEAELDKNLRDVTSLLLNYMKEKDCFLSAEDIKTDKLFVNYSIEIEAILNKLWEKNMIKKEYRELKSLNGKALFKENVYFV